MTEQEICENVMSGCFFSPISKYINDFPFSQLKILLK